jgi:hypothetical protein
MCTAPKLNSTNGGTFRQKTVSFTVKRKISQEEYLAATFGAFFMFFRLLARLLKV